MAEAALGRLAAALRAAASELETLDQSWALVGGLAVSARSEPRFTRDIDIAVAVTEDRDAERLVNHFLRKGYQMLASVEQEHTQRLATVRLTGPGEDAIGVVLDLLFASSGIESELVAGAERLEVLPGAEWPVARPGHLLALKLLAVADERPQDRMDIASLLAHSDEEALRLAREAVRLIEERGYHRGRDLSGELERHIAAATA